MHQNQIQKIIKWCHVPSWTVETAPPECSRGAYIGSSFSNWTP